MTPQDFFIALLRVKGYTPNSLAVAIKKKNSQGSISRFLRTHVREPRSRAWAQPAASLLGFDIEALRNEAVATKEAARLGLLGLTVAPPPSLGPVRRQARIDPGVIVLQIADLMREFSEAKRNTAAALFSNAALFPDEAPALADTIRTLLADSRKRQDARTA